jgi:DNA-binding transcriptional LysR family regulator
MNLRQMEVFHAVMTAGSVVGAAQLLHISQPGVSIWLRGLEEQIGIPLFHRARGRLVPTRDALALYADIRKIFDQVQVARTTADQLRRGMLRRLEIVCVVPLGAVLVPRAVTSFMAEYPNIHVHLKILPRREILELITVGAVDLGISFQTPDLAGMQTEEIGRGRLVCLMPYAHPLAERAEVTAADIIAHPWISYVESQSLYPLIEQAFEASHACADAPIRVPSIATACSLVECGAGISLVDEFSAASLASHLARKPFVPATPVTVSVLHPGTARPPPLVAAFVGHMRRLMG